MNRQAQLLIAIARLVTLLVLSPALAAAQQADWPQFDFDAQHGGATDQETTIHPGNVSTLHALYPAVTLPSIADGAPAFLPGVATAGGVKDLIFLTTKDGHLLALDAADGTTVWSRQPATGPRYTTSSPAIDPSRLYVYGYGLDGKAHKYAVGNGAEVTTGGWPATTTLKPDVEKGSSALSIATAGNASAYLYVANGGYPGDAGDYQGHVTAIDLATGVQKVFNADCSDQTVHFVENASPDCSAVQTAIWARAGVVYDAGLDRIFMATGNGDYDGNTGGHDWGDTVFALHPDATGTGGRPVDTYTPTEFQHLQDVDADLGSTAPAILPAPAGSGVAHLGLQSGKDAELRLLDLGDLSGMGGPGHLGGELQKIAVPQGGQVLTAPAVWVDPVAGDTWAFVANGSGISGLELALAGGAPSLAVRWTNATGGSSPVIANGMVFYASSAGIKALDPTTGHELWSGSLGGIHWESPIVSGGKLFVTDENAKLWVYGPSPEPLAFYTLAPCRLVDTRQPAGPLGGPALAGGGARRVFPVAGHCGVPAGARAVAANVTVVAPSGPGDLRLGPVGLGDRTSTINFRAGQARANEAILSLTGNPLGEVAVQTDILPGATHLVVDVSGYFQ
jgi:hypothetical protein